MSEKRAVFCEIGRSWPEHCAHPLGAKLKPKMRISATNGLDIPRLPETRRNGQAQARSRLRGEDAEQRNDEVQALVGLPVVVRLAASGHGRGGGAERGIRRARPKNSGTGLGAWRRSGGWGVRRVPLLTGIGRKRGGGVNGSGPC